jgi:hypothetical protein
LINKYTKQQTQQIFKGIQLSAADFGTEKMLHSIRIAREANISLDFMQSDYKNGFNEIHRSQIIKESAEHAPKFLSYLVNSLSPITELTYIGFEKGSRTIKSSMGCPQGAPLGSINYSLATKTFNEQINEIVNTQGGLFRAYVDDVGVVAKTETILDVIRYQQTEGPKYGVHLNLEKEIILLGYKGGKLEAQAAKQQYIKMGIPAKQIKTHPDDEKSNI